MKVLITTENKKLSPPFAAACLLANVLLICLLAPGLVSFAFNSLLIVVHLILPCNILLPDLIRNPI